MKTAHLITWLALTSVLGLAAGCELIATADRSRIPTDGGMGGEGGDVPLGGGGMGGMPECTTADECEGDATDCVDIVCEDGMCGEEQAAVGDPCDENGGNACDANGICVECVDNTHCDANELCDTDTNTCFPEQCFDGIENGTESAIDCGGDDCPPCDNGLACVDFEDCASQFCDAFVCAPCSVDSNCQVDDFCDASTNCVDKMVLGDACGGDNECLDDNCIDGVCCDGLCDSTCEACNIAGSEGTCTPHAVGTDPDNECVATDACNGLVAPDTNCGCSDGVTNFNETDTDCGGADCSQCVDGSTCQAPGDCSSQVCIGNQCQVPRCGDGVMHAGEMCDDGNDNVNDDCPSGPTGNCQPATCGDGFLHNLGAGTEACDDANANNNDDCLDSCAIASCGDMFLHNQGSGTEECDDGNNVNNDDCLNNCDTAECGDGVVHDQGTGTEECDDNNANNNDDCLDTCVDASCGDGFVHNQGTGTEECDDNNANNNDDCLDTCVDASCGDGFVHNQGTGTEECDDNNANNNDDCIDTCLDAVCGDGFVHDQGSGTEPCDDANANNNDDCLVGCVVASCSDGFTHDQGTGAETDIDCGGGCLTCPGGLLLSELVVAPTTDEFIEIYNPGTTTVNLSHVYLADYSTYFGITTGANNPGSSDFRVQFPAGSSIAAGARVTIALSSATSFNTSFGFFPDFDLDTGDANAPAMIGQFSASSGATNSAEMLVMFTWDGEAAVVADIDYLLYGSTANAMDKTGIGAYLTETALASQAFVASPASGSSAGRCDPLEGSETLTGGNGYLGHDETSEDLDVTWEVGAPTPGAANTCAGALVFNQAFGGTLDDLTLSTVSDSSGNAVITGSFASASLAFGATTLTQSGSGDVFVAKVDPAGAPIWAINPVGASGFDEGFAVTIDGSGDVLVTGRFESATLQFPGGSVLTNTGMADVFVAKLNGTTGAHIWSVSATGDVWERGQDIATDASGDVFVTGLFTSTNLSFGTTALATAGGDDMFVAKLAGGTGAEIWAIRAGGSANDAGWGLGVDATGDALISGDFASTSLQIGTGTALANSGVRDVYAAKLAGATGAHLWSVASVGAGAEFNFDAAVDGSGDLVIGGRFNTAAANFGTTALSNTGGDDLYVAKLSGTDGSEVWAISGNGAGNDQCFRVAVDSSGNVLCGGGFESATLSIAGAPSVTNSGMRDAVAFKLSGTAGALLWTKSATGSAFDEGLAIAADPMGNAIVAGQFASDPFNWGFTGDALSNAGGQDIFVALLQP